MVCRTESNSRCLKAWPTHKPKKFVSVRAGCSFTLRSFWTKNSKPRLHTSSAGWMKILRPAVSLAHCLRFVKARPNGPSNAMRFWRRLNCLVMKNCLPDPTEVKIGWVKMLKRLSQFPLAIRSITNRILIFHFPTIVSGRRTSLRIGKTKRSSPFPSKSVANLKRTNLLGKAKTRRALTTKPINFARPTNLISKRL